MNNNAAMGRSKRAEASPLRETAPSATGKGQETKFGLLEAAESILLEEGIQALTFRRIGTVAGINPTLVTYYFGSIAGLLAELCQANLEPVQSDCEAIFRDDANFASLREVLQVWITTLLRPAAFTKGGRSLVVLDEIAAHGDADLRHQLLGSMRDFSQRVQAVIHPFVPELSVRELRARVRFLSAAALSPPPRSRLIQDNPSETPPDETDYLLAFAEAALTPLSSCPDGTRTRMPSALPRKRAKGTD